MRPATAAHVEGDKAMAIGKCRLPTRPELGAAADAMMEQDRLAARLPRYHLIEQVVMQRTVRGPGDCHDRSGSIGADAGFLDDRGPLLAILDDRGLQLLR